MRVSLMPSLSLLLACVYVCVCVGVVAVPSPSTRVYYADSLAPVSSCGSNGCPAQQQQGQTLAQSEQSENAIYYQPIVDMNDRLFQYDSKPKFQSELHVDERPFAPTSERPNPLPGYNPQTHCVPSINGQEPGNCGIMITDSDHCNEATNKDCKKSEYCSSNGNSERNCFPEATVSHCICMKPAPAPCDCNSSPTKPLRPEMRVGEEGAYTPVTAAQLVDENQVAPSGTSQSESSKSECTNPLGCADSATRPGLKCEKEDCSDIIASEDLLSNKVPPKVAQKGALPPGFTPAATLKDKCDAKSQAAGKCAQHTGIAALDAAADQMAADAKLLADATAKTKAAEQKVQTVEKVNDMLINAKNPGVVEYMNYMATVIAKEVNAEAQEIATSPDHKVHHKKGSYHGQVKAPSYQAPVKGANYQGALPGNYMGEYQGSPATATQKYSAAEKNGRLPGSIAPPPRADPNGYQAPKSSTASIDESKVNKKSGVTPNDPKVDSGASMDDNAEPQDSDEEDVAATLPGGLKPSSVSGQASQAKPKLVALQAPPQPHGSPSDKPRRVPTL